MNRLFTLKNIILKNNKLNRNLFYRFIDLAESNPYHIPIKQKENNIWISYNNKKIQKMIQDCRYFLKNNNIKKSDHIIYKGKNSIDWLVWNMSVLSLGAIWIPIYNNQNLDYIKHVVNDSKPKLIIYDDDNFPTKQFSNYFIHKSNIKENNFSNFDYIHNDLSHLIYTSGTSGKPKGVKLNHINLLSNINSINKQFHDIKNINNLKTLNILPWAHIYSLNTELYYNIFNKNTIYLCNNPQNLIKEIYEIKPNLLYLVPRVLEEIHKKLQFLDKPVLNKLIPLIFKKLFGNELITIFIGGSKLHYDTANFFLNNNINICEGYGTTEASPMISVNHMKNPRNLESIGYILDDIDVKIINNEICISGVNVSDGYFNNEEKNKEVFIIKNNKKYYKTGDSGFIKDKFLFYTGRISNNYKLSNGKFIQVDEIEKNIKNFIKTPFSIYGENKEYNIIIIENNQDKDILSKINKNIPKYAQIKKILNLEKNSFSNFLTPKMSLKKKELFNSYFNEINDLYKN